MINVNLQVRRAEARDHDQIASLTFNEYKVHRHLDWHTPFEWLGSPNYWVLEEDGRVVASLACPEDPPHIAWVRFFGSHQDFSESRAWNSLWNVARKEIMFANRKTIVAAIAVKHWFQTALLSSGFELKQNIVLLELRNENAALFSLPPGIRIRPMVEADIPEVAEVDLAAFGEFWHNTANALLKAYAQSAFATVAEDDLGMVGYQLSTRNLLGAHLARLGVRPEAQGRGVGSVLVSHLIRSIGAGQLNRLSVNTQADNVVSLSLYKKLGFVRTGEQFPVLVYSIGGQ